MESESMPYGQYFASAVKYVNEWLQSSLYRFIYREIHRFWQGRQERDLTFLEVGGGLCIYPLVSAAPHIKHVVFSDYDHNCRRAVHSWLKKEEGSFDWGPITKHIVTELEGKGENEVVKRQDEIREKIRDVIHCDIHKDGVIDKASLPKELQPPYDVVSANLCLCVCSNSNEQFKENFCKLAELVKPGGFLLFADDGEATYYCVGNEKNSVFPITEELLQEALEMSGLEVLTRTIELSDLPDSLCSDKFYIFVAARKPTK